MTIVLTGGGSGGHITPILAVAAELKKLSPDTHIVYIGQRGDNLADITQVDPSIDEVFTVRAGKFRRYHGEGVRQLFDIPTVAKNLRDVLYVLVGLWQSYWLIRRLRPSIIFTRGGYVSVPVALGGALQGIPYITHDADSTPSLANRMIARWAVLHAVALPEELYPYPRSKTITVGVPVSSKYKIVTPKLQREYRRQLGLDPVGEVILVTGGGNGAQQLNTVVVDNADYLLKHHPRLIILHVTGKHHKQVVTTAYDKILPPDARKRVVVKGFVNDSYLYSGAADVVVSRGGAASIAEFALQKKACVIIPSPQLIWNVKNNELLARRQAVIELTEDQATQERRLASVLSSLLNDATKRTRLSEELASLAKPDAAKHLATEVFKQAKMNTKR